ncbi:MAG: hypothetical protein ACK4ZX_10060 [Thermus sp.]
MPNPRPKVPPKPLRLKALGVEGLEEGETSVVLRIRGPAGAVQVLATLSPKERGQVVALGLEALGLWRKEDA